VQLKRTVSQMIGGLWGDEARGDSSDVLVARVADFDYPTLGIKAVETVRSVPPHLQSHRRLRSGDLLIEKSGGGDNQNVGRVVSWGSPDPAISSNFINVLRCAAGFDPRFLAYLHRSLYILGLAAACTKQTTGIQNLDLEAYLSAEVRLPELPRQKRIADSLDRECRRIREINIARVAQMSAIDALRQAWLDEAMAGAPTAGTIRLRDLLRSPPCYGVLVPRFSGEHGVPFIRVSDLSGLATRVLPTIAASQSVEYSRSIVAAGDVLISVVGSVDRSAIVPESLVGANVARAVARLQPADGVPPFFLWACTRTSQYREQARLFTSSDTAQPTLNMGDLSRFRLTAPRTVEERAAMERRLRDGFELSNKLAAETLHGEAALAEYQDALITEAVTGQLDLTRISDSQMEESLDRVRLGERPEVLAS
jgi:type I restriction enzyme, S subunit